MLTEEEFKCSIWKCTYEQYKAFQCKDCSRKENCIHHDAFRRVPIIDGGLGLCPNLKGATA